MELENEINTVNSYYPYTILPLNGLIVHCSFILHLFKMYDIANLAVCSDMIKTQFSFLW